MVYVIWFVFWMVLGGVLGANKGRATGGILWSLVLGPIGVLIVCCLPNLKEREKRLAAEAEEREVALRRSNYAPASPAAPAAESESIFPDRPRVEMLRVAAAGQDLGEHPVATIREMIAAEKLTWDDYYYDPEAGDWQPLSTCAKLAD